MIVLSIETSGPYCSIALDTGDGVYFEWQSQKNRHTEQLLPTIEQFMIRAGLTLLDIDVLAWTSGPGSFTGLRIGASAVQALAYALDLPVVNVPTLQALAQTAYRDHGVTRAAVAMDARMQQIYWGLYVLGERNIMRPMIEDSLISPDKSELPDSNWAGVGTGWQQYADGLVHLVHNNQAQIINDHCYPDADAVRYPAIDYYRNGHHVNADGALPCYLRQQVVHN